MTDLLYSDVEDDLRASVRALIADRAPVATTLARVESGAAYDAGLWRALSTELGVAGLAVPERFGGAGASLREAAVVLEELGRAVVPVPFLTNSIVAASALVAAQASDLLAKLSTGESIVVLAVPFFYGPSRPVGASVGVDGGRLTGSVAGVADGFAADVLLVVAADGLYAVPATGPGVTRTGKVSFDLTRPLADIRLDRAPGERIGDVSLVGDALRVGAALLASEQLGVAEWCLETTVAYVKTRHQFGRPVGSYQALKHRLADVWVELAQARAAARYAADCAATGAADLPVAAALAQAYCAPVAVKAAEECVQLHGGIGFTWEHPAHLFLKRAKSDSLAYGTSEHHRQALATLVDLAP